MNPKISVIVPVYNVEKYISECIDSILKQTYREYELILVDDGSHDSSGAICDRYSCHNFNVSVIHQENQGLSGARNSGVKLSTGEYITFVDSDDVISNDFLEVLMKATTDDCDVVVAGMQKFSDVIPDTSKKSVEINSLSNEEALKILCNQTKFGNSACAKLYKRYLVEKYPYPISEGFTFVS